MKFGPSIPHNPEGYTAKGGTHYPAVFPYDPETPVLVQLGGGVTSEFSSPARSFIWTAFWKDSEIISYRLPADHHAYGPKRSVAGHEPDAFFNAYEDYQSSAYAFAHRNRVEADEFADTNLRIGIWRAYKK